MRRLPFRFILVCIIGIGTVSLGAVSFHARYTKRKAKVYFSQALEYMRKKEFNEAIEMCEASLRLYPKDEKVWCELGIAYMEKGEFREATYYLKEAIHLKSNYPKAHYALAVAYLRGDPADIRFASYHASCAKDLGYLVPDWFNNYLKQLVSN